MILYIGNKLHAHGKTPTSVDTLGEQLKEHFPMVTISDKKNIIIRFLHIVWIIFSQRKRWKLLLVDTYSTNNFYYALASAVLARWFKIPYIPILHGGSLPARLKNSPNLCKRIFNNSFTNVSPSTYLCKAFREHGYKIDYIPNSIELDLYPLKLRNSFSPKFLYVRSFHKIYNPELAIEVMSLISKRYKNFVLCMVGPDKDGTLNKVKEMAKELQLDKQVIFTGQLSKKEWIQLAKDYDVFINTTNFDNHPVSVIEAMALGLPVISTNVGGIPYLIVDGEDGLLVPPKNAAAFEEAIRKVLEKPEFGKELAMNGRIKAEKFQWKIIKADWQQLIDSALQNKGM